jgi:hypothetical protein
VLRVDEVDRLPGRLAAEGHGGAPAGLRREDQPCSAASPGLARPHARAIDVALRPGYADQAHFTRELAALAGVRPGDVLKVPTG